jgi:hypothetical protein
MSIHNYCRIAAKNAAKNEVFGPFLALTISHMRKQLTNPVAIAWPTRQ